MYKIANIEDFSIFLASDDIRGDAEKMIANAKIANRKFLAEHRAEPPKMRISGTFVYAHAPNYRGRPLHNYLTADWIKLMRELQETGMDTVIMQAALWHELNECYYPSSHFKYPKNWNVVEPMLEAAEVTGMNVFLGGYGSVTGWREDLTPEIIRQEKDQQRMCLQELVSKYSGRFTGIYFAPETAYHGERNLKKEAFLNDLYRDFCGAVKRMSPETKILMSPGTKYFPGRMRGMVEAWLAILDGVPLDIMAPQDSIGTCGNTLCHQPETYRIWDEICRERGIEFWSNIEIFERKGELEGADYNRTASPEKVAFQINHAAPYAEKLICWEAPFYLSPLAGEEGLRLRQSVLATVHAGV